MTFLKKHIIPDFLITVSLVLTACGNLDEIRLVEDPLPAEPAAPFVMPSLSLAFQLEGVASQSRDGSQVPATVNKIGSGSLIDYIIYAIYDAQDNLLADFADPDKASINIGDKEIKAGEGQNLVRWTGEYITVSLDSLSEGDYKLVCWAQSSQCDAYDTSDLKKVTVSYDNALNNDETRDAFCVSQSFSIKEGMGDEEAVVATLKRPLAQINVGTTGADYANNEKFYGGVLYTYSTVTLKGVSDTINVVDDVVGDPINGEVTFGYNKLAAFVAMDIPTTHDGLIHTLGEELLLIHLNEATSNDKDGNGYDDFLTQYPTVEYEEGSDEISRYLTEEFKYMSMCYVLIPANADGESSTIDNFKVTFADNDKGDNLKTSVTKTPLPVKRNRRTNLIGGIYSPGDNDTDLPVDDPTTLFSKVNCNVMVITTYFDDYNLINGELVHP